jgi:hypothetical protein
MWLKSEIAAVDLVLAPDQAGRPVA